MRIQYITGSALLLILALVGCTLSAAKPHDTPMANAHIATAPQTLTVLAAASLTEPFSELGQQFEASHPGVKVSFNFGGSQQLAQQLAQGAQADLFASASLKYMDVVVTAGRVVSGTVRIFARNHLVVIYPLANPAGLNTLQDLAKPGLKLVLAAKVVPVGQYALDFLDKAVQDAAFGQAFKVDVLTNVVSYEDNVKAVLTKVALGEADAGIVYSSDISGDAANKVGRIDIPAALNVIAEYPIAVLEDSAMADLAKAFMDLVLSAPGQQVLARYGFISAVGPSAG
jgi:molybdate transport system substrate-binding protein